MHNRYTRPDTKSPPVLVAGLQGLQLLVRERDRLPVSGSEGLVASEAPEAQRDTRGQILSEKEKSP